MLFDYKDFDHWSLLAKESPETFESVRNSAIEELIQSAPEESQHRLRCRQWQVDQTRLLSKTPMDACIKISEMMMESLMHSQDILNRLQSDLTTEQGADRSGAGAKVLKMPARTGSQG